jgi:hypothetical protein
MPFHARALACTALLFLASCGDSPTGFPDNPGAVGAAAEATARIAAEAETRFEALLAGAVAAGDYVDTRDVEAELLRIEGVAATQINRTGTVVRLRQRDGAWLNVPLARRGDPRLFVYTRGNPSVSPRPAPEPAEPSSSAAPAAVTFPAGARALILAPFQREFGEDLEAVATPLRLAGFTVDIYHDEQAGIERFRGSFLSGYDVVYVSSHGAASVVSRDGETETTMVVTGTRAGRDADVALHGESRSEYAMVGQFSTGDGVFYGVGGHWIEATEGSFGETLFYLNFPESSAYTAGPESLLASLHDMGAAGVIGWRQVINQPMANAVAARVVASLSRGRSLQQAVNDVRTDLAFLLYGWWLRVRLIGEIEPSVRVDLLDRTQLAPDAYHLFDPARIVADAAVFPGAGPVGTAVTFEVKVRPDFVALVTRVDLDVVSSGERFAMVKTGSDLWRLTGLVAPAAPSYPRVDTFIYRARRADNVVLGSGSLTFTTTGPSASVQPPGIRWSRAP